MSWDNDKLLNIIRTDPELHLSPVVRQVIINRLEYPATEGEITRARNQIMGRSPNPTRASV